MRQEVPGGVGLLYNSCSLSHSVHSALCSVTLQFPPTHTPYTNCLHLASGLFENAGDLKTLLASQLRQNNPGHLLRRLGGHSRLHFHRILNSLKFHSHGRSYRSQWRRPLFPGLWAFRKAGFGISSVLLPDKEVRTTPTLSYCLLSQVF